MSQNVSTNQPQVSPSCSDATMHHGPPPYSEPSKARSKPEERQGLSHLAAVNLELSELDLRLSDEDVLRDGNWIHWKMRISILLDVVDLGDYPLGKVPQPDKNREHDAYEIWHARDRGAFHILLNNISNKQLLNTPICHTDKDFTSAELWDSLRQRNENHSSLAVVLKLRKLYSAQAEEGCDIEKHISNLEHLRFELADAKHRIDDELFNCIVVTSLPSSWDDYTAHVRCLQSFQGDTGISTPRLVGMLLFEYRRRLKSSTTGKKRKREGEACAICRKDNHIAAECHWKGVGYCNRCERGGHWTGKCGQH